jgi:GTP cyclohydrolase II
MNLKQLLIGKHNADQAKSLKLIQKEWALIVGDSMASKSKPVKLMDNCLTIDALTSSSQSELSLLNQAIANRIMEKHQVRIITVKVRR